VHEYQLQFEVPNGRRSQSPLRSNSSSPGPSPAIILKDLCASIPHPLVPLLHLHTGEEGGGVRCSQDLAAHRVVASGVEVGKDLTNISSLLARGSPAQRPAPHTPGKFFDTRSASPSCPRGKNESRNGTANSRAATRSPYDASPGRREPMGSRGGDKRAASPARAGSARGPSPGVVKGVRSKGGSGAAGTGAVGQHSPFRRVGLQLQHGATGGSVKMTALPALPSPL